MKKRWLLIALAVLVLLIASALIGGPYIAKNYIQENSQELIGRKVLMERLHFNALNGHVLITDFRLFEPDENTHFVQFDTLFINLALYKLFSGHLWSDALHLKGLNVNLWMDGDVFNFSDLIPPADSTSNDTIKQEESFINKVTFNDIQILHSAVDYEDKKLAVNHNLKDLNIKLPGISISDEQTKAGLEFAFTEGGVFRTNIDYNLIENSYKWVLEIEQLDLAPFTRYAQESLHINALQGWFSGNVTIIGDIDEPAKPIVSGSMNINNFLLTDSENKEVVGFSSVFMDAKEINLVTNNFHFGSLHVNKPTIHAVLSASGDNLSALVKTVQTNVDSAIAKEEAIEEQPLHYLLDEFRLNDGTFDIEDNTMQAGVFAYNISNINFAANQLSEGRPVTFDMSALLNKKGTFTGKVITDPGNPGNGTFNFDIKNTSLADFSVYCENSTAFPITDGRFAFQTRNTIVNNHLNSHLVLQMFKTGLGDKRKDLKPDVNVPLKLGLVVLEDTKGRINIDVPAEGDIDDPEFKYSKLIWKVVLNVLVKAATSPYNLLAGAVGANEDDIKFVRMENLQEELNPEQTTQLDLIADLLTQKPELSVNAMLHVNAKKERQYVREFLAKKGYYLQQNYGSDSANVVLSAVDHIKIMEIEEDEGFASFLESKTNTETGTLKLDALIDLYVKPSSIEAAHKSILEKRMLAVLNYMKQKDCFAQFTLDETFAEDATYNRPRFEMTYQVAE